MSNNELAYSSCNDWVLWVLTIFVSIGLGLAEV